MKYIFKFPDIGEGLDEGTIVEWKVKKGQEVDVGTALVTMETDKVVTDIPSPKKGIISTLYGKVGETINVGDALVEIEIAGIDGEKAVTEAESGSDLDLVEEEAAGVVGSIEVAGNNAILSASSEGVAAGGESEDKSKRKVLATPVSRAMARDMGIDINDVKGTGPAGRVMKEDILSYSKSRSKRVTATTEPSEDVKDAVTIEPLTQIRKTIAKNMLQSKHNAAHMTVFDETEISELDRVRKKFKDKYADEGIKITYLAFVVKATAYALKRHKSLNSEMDLENGNMIYKNYYNIGIAVDTEKGLMVPVIKKADNLSIKEIAKKIDEFSSKARDGEITLDDMKDGTFTITSFGSIGGKFAVPVINYPQAGILGIGRVSKQAIVKNDELGIGLVLPLSLAVDHRIADGGETARFLNDVMDYLNDPVSLLIE